MIRSVVIDILPCGWAYQRGQVCLGGVRITWLHISPLERLRSMERSLIAGNVEMRRAMDGRGGPPDK